MEDKERKVIARKKVLRKRKEVRRMWKRRQQLAVKRQS